MTTNLRSEIYSKLLLEEDQDVRKEMEKRLNEINCLYCFDLKTVWDPRSKEHQLWGRFAFNTNNFYVAICEHCGTHQFLFDTNDTNQGNYSEYNRLRRSDQGFESRVGELKRVCQHLNLGKIDINDFIKKEAMTATDFTIKTNDQNQETPCYEVESNFFKQNISKTNFSADVKKICEILGGVLQAHVGIPNISLIKKIELSFQMETKNQKNEQVFYHSTEDNRFFTFILIKQMIKDKNGNLLGIFNGEKNLTEIECHYWIYKAKNQSAVDVLLKKQQEAVNNEFMLMSQILDSHYNK